MKSKLIPLIVVAALWLQIPEYRLVLGITYLSLTFYEIFKDNDKIHKKLLVFLSILQVVPFLNSSGKISDYILILALTINLLLTRKIINLSRLFLIGVFSIFINFTFNILYAFAGKMLSFIQFMGFDNSGHLGLLHAINSTDKYLTFIGSETGDTGLQYWRSYPQGVMGSIESIIRIVGLENVDNNKFSFYVIYFIFNAGMYAIFTYQVFLIIKNNARFNFRNLLIVMILCSTSILSIFLVNGFINNMYSLVILLLYANILGNKNTILYKCLVLFLMVFSAPFILPIFIIKESIVYLTEKKSFYKKLRSVKSIELLFYFLVVSTYIVFYYDKLGLQHFTVSGWTPHFEIRNFIILALFWPVLVTRICLLKKEVDNFEIIVGTAQLVFFIFALLVFWETQSISYFAIKQGYISIILTIIYLLNRACQIRIVNLVSSNILKTVSLLFIVIMSQSSQSLINRVNFYQEFGSGSPQIAVDGTKVIKSIAIGNGLEESFFVYIGVFDSDLSSRLLNGGLSKWNDYSSGLFYGLVADADLSTVLERINGFYKLPVDSKSENYIAENSKFIVFYERNTKISSEINGNSDFFEGIVVR